MTAPGPTPPGPRAPQTLAERVAAEEARVAAGEPACGHRCDHHGGYTCVRLTHGDDAHCGGRLPDGGLVTWTGPCEPDNYQP